MAQLQALADKDQGNLLWSDAPNRISALSLNPKKSPATPNLGVSNLGTESTWGQAETGADITFLSNYTKKIISVEASILDLTLRRDIEAVRNR